MIDFKNMAGFVCLAPMAGVTDVTFREICSEMGCDYCVTEMISAQGLMLSPNDHIQRQLMARSPKERAGIQLFGSQTLYMSQAASKVGANYDFIDINMGCPAPKITKGGAGAALGRDRGLARIVIESVLRASSVPVTVKIRLGWDGEHLNHIDMAEMIGETGASALAIHARTREQGYSGKADMSAVAESVKVCGIPVLANGDITTPEDVSRVFEQTGCAGVMIGRGSMGNPFLFRQSKQYLATGKYDPVEREERIAVAQRHIEAMRALKGERVATLEMRKHIGWYIKGLSGAGKMRVRVNAATSTDELNELLRRFMLTQEVQEV